MAYKDQEKQRANDRNRHSRDREKRLAAMRKYRKDHIEKERARGRLRTKTHRKEIRAYQLKRKYGLTPEAFESMLIGQGSVCAICGSSSWGSHGPIVDHDHKAGNIRGILCMNCNLALGYMGDNLAVSKAMVHYLDQHLGGN